MMQRNARDIFENICVIIQPDNNPNGKAAGYHPAR
jgi:hypothetical protein